MPQINSSGFKLQISNYAPIPRYDNLSITQCPYQQHTWQLDDVAANTDKPNSMYKLYNIPSKG